MKEFNWDKFKTEDIAVYFNTKEEAKNFLLQCDKHNIKWALETGKASELVLFDSLNHIPCYTFSNDEINGLTQNNKDYFINKNYTIINWSDYMKQYTYETFTKDMLKDGMVVETKNKQLYYVIKERIISEDKFVTLSGDDHYDNNLKNKINSNYDII